MGMHTIRHTYSEISRFFNTVYHKKKYIVCCNGPLLHANQPYWHHDKATIMSATARCTIKTSTQDFKCQFRNMVTDNVGLTSTPIWNKIELVTTENKLSSLKRISQENLAGRERSHNTFIICDIPAGHIVLAILTLFQLGCSHQWVIWRHMKHGACKWKVTWILAAFLLG